MRLVGIAELESGDVLGKAVHGRNGVVMLEAGTVLTEQYINRLRNLRINAVHLLPRINGGSDSSYRSGKVPPSFFDPHWIRPDIDRMKDDDKAREKAVKLVADFADKGLMQDRLILPVPEEKFRANFRDVLHEIASRREFAEELGVMMLTDPILFNHAMNVTLCADIIGTAKNFDSAKMYELSLGALFSDIGMTRLPMELTKVNRALSETEIKMVRQHTTEGYHLLKGMKDVPTSSAQIALLHHERYRGEGYPLGVKQEGIPEFAQIVGLADVYNALISPRHHRKPFAPGEATEYLFASGNYDFDLSLVQVFLKYLTIYPIGSVVKLSTGQIGVVLETAGRPMNRPVVQIFCEANGTVAKLPYILDLQELNNVVITGKADK
ncbi:HD-GYP domain-containing protein [Cohnella yongneupensis]|uniref:HD-GYP domain-containing protein n=1 Tax=Cohnella yongneupensis TaxID=425006 RepID=A0ABW0R6W1_9BACL